MYGIVAAAGARVLTAQAPNAAPTSFPGLGTAAPAPLRRPAALPANPSKRRAAVHLERDEWDMGGMFLTPSFKLKRAPLQQHYQKEIDEMYSGLRVTDAQKRAQADAKRKAQGG